MIGSLRGTLLSKSPGEVIVEAGGVGYVLSVPTGTLSEMPDAGKEAFLHVYTHVREDALQLFGFGTDDEKKLFVMLIGVSGVGPKTALNIISGISHEDFLRAVDSEDIETLSRAPGLGKKTAKRLVLELRGKLPKEEALGVGVYADALSALVNLGYRRAEAGEAVEAARKKGLEEIEAVLKESLKYLTGAADEKG